MYETIREWEQRENGVMVLGRLGFENAYAFAMRQDRAAELDVTSLTSLAAAARAAPSAATRSFRAA